MAKNDEIEVLIDDPKLEEVAKGPEKEKVEVVPQDEVVVERADDPEIEKAPIKTADEGIEELKKQLEDAQKRSEKDKARIAQERSRRVAAEKEASEALARSVQFQTEAQKNRHGQIVNGLESAKNAEQAAKAAYAAAFAAGDPVAMGEAQAAISRASSRVVQYEDAQAAIEEQITQQKEPTTQRTQNADPVEQFASTLSPKAGDWVRNHPECVQDQRKYNQMMAAHYEAVNDDIQAGTDEYFQYLDQKLGYAEAEPVVQQERPKKTRVPSAPPSRDVPDNSGAGGNPRRVVLTKEEVEFAEINGMTPREYALNKLQLQKEGRIGPSANRN